MSFTASIRAIAVLFAIVAMASNRSACSVEAPIPAKIEFNRDVRPILSDNCFHCHGLDKNSRKADLRLDLREVALKAAESGETPIVPGKPEASELVRRIASEDADEIMPPRDSNKSLTSRQKEILKRWVVQGAQYQQHWSFESPVKAVVPTGQNGIDLLVKRRLSEVGLNASPEADRRTLIRRLSFDLLGLPPTPQEVAAFVND